MNEHHFQLSYQSGPMAKENESKSFFKKILKKCFRGIGREKEKHQLAPTRACVLIRNQTGNPFGAQMVFNQQSHTSQSDPFDVLKYITES